MTGDWETDTRESYDRVAEPYADFTREAASGGNAYMSGVYATLASLVRGTAAPATVVDVGCGPGWWVHHLQSLGPRCLGIDLSPAMVELARVNVPSARFTVGSILDIPVPTTTAEGVVCWYVLHHLPDDSIDAALKELVRILVPGGILLIGGHLGSTRRIKEEGYGGHPMHVQINLRPATLWEDKVRALGLIIEAHTIYDPGTPTPSHALFARKPSEQRPDVPR
jgi:SAM-dependent methyltransferase